MLEASVLSSRTSASSNACGVRLSSAMTPRTRSPARIGTPSHDSVVRPKVIAPCCTASAAVARLSGARDRMTCEVRPGPKSRTADG